MPPTAAVALLLLAAAVAGCSEAGDTGAPPGGAAAGTGPGLRLLASQRLAEAEAFEPSVEVAADGTVYVTAAQGVSIGAGSPRASRLWVSRDAGASFVEVRPVDPAGTGVSNLPFGAEGDLAVDAAGRAYYTDLSVAGATLSRSTDQGRTWELRNPSTFLVPGGDRQWVAAGPEDRVALAWNQLAGEPADPATLGAPVPSGLWVAMSEDGGRTFPVQAHLPGSGYSFSGGIAMASDGAIAVARLSGDVTAWVSHDGGRTFEPSTVHATAGNATYLMPFVDADAAGTLYVAWAEQAGDRSASYYASSRDGGRSWSAPVRVSSPDEASVMPHVDAGEAGHVAIAHYCAPGQAGAPEKVQGAWYPCVADVHGADTAAPRVASLRMAEGPVRTGGVCTGGLLGGCTGGSRNLGDYLQGAIGADGRVHVAWADEARQVFWGVAAPVPSPP